MQPVVNKRQYEAPNSNTPLRILTVTRSNLPGIPGIKAHTRNEYENMQNQHSMKRLTQRHLFLKPAEALGQVRGQKLLTLSQHPSCCGPWFRPVPARREARHFPFHLHPMITN